MKYQLHTRSKKISSVRITTGSLTKDYVRGLMSFGGLSSVGLLHQLKQKSVCDLLHFCGSVNTLIARRSVPMMHPLPRFL